jgi:hypothetical protein
MSQKTKLIGVGVVAALGLSTTALVTGAIFPTEIKNQTKSATATYEEIAPYVKEYLAANNLVSASGELLVPNTSDASGAEVASITVEEALTRLINNGTLEYVSVKGEKGDKGDTGATGAQGATGAAGQNGANGQDGADGGGSVTAGDGLEYSGGVLSMKPCAVDQVLSYNGTTWDCATVTAGGVDGNTTNTVASLTLSGTMLQATMTDSAGNTVSTNKIDLGAHFVTNSDLSDYATTAQVGALSARVSNLESAAAGYATESWVAAQNYLTSSGLATYLTTHGYVTDSALTTVLSSYLLKNDFAATLNTHLLAGDGVAITQDGNGNSVIESLHNAEIFTMVNDHLAVAVPETNKIYVDIDESPMKEYIYLNGANGAPLDPTNAAAWSEVGSVTVDLSGYSTTDQMNSAINNALTNQLNDLANHSNLNTILTNYVKTGDMDAAIASATSDMATQTWVNAQGFLTSSSLVGNATETWVNSQNFATMTDLDAFYTMDEVDSLLADKANQSALDATNVRVSALDAAMSSKQDKLTAGSNITISGNVISANVDLSTYATKSYVDSQDFLTNANALASYATQSYVNSQGFLKSDALNDYATKDYVDSNGHLTIADLDGYATQSWVAGKNYLTNAGLATYLTNNNYAQDSDIAAAIAGADDEYVSHTEFGETLHDHIKAGSGIAIGADNTISATMFVMTTNRLTVANPDPNMIYVETGADASSPVSQYMYLNGKDGAPLDPTNAAAWLKIGDLSGVDLSPYSTTDQMHAAINAAIEAEVDEFNKTYATQSWVDSQGYLKSADLDGYATQSWVDGNYLKSSALGGYATQAWTNAQGFLKKADLATYATQDYVNNQGFITASTLNTYGYATQAWVTGQKYLTEDAAKATYVTQTGLAATLAGYQPLITGGATTITSANLTANMVLQSDGNGKVAASGVTMSSLSTALTDIAALKSQQATNMAAIAALQSTVSSSNNEGAWGEIDTGKTFRGKKVYRQDFTLYVQADANVNSDLELIGKDNYVDDIVSVGGWWTIGYQTERWQIPSSGAGSTNYAYVVIHGSGNRLKFRSMANNGRSSAQAIVIVEYTKK